MVQIAEAVFDGTVLRPHVPLTFQENERVLVTVQSLPTPMQPPTRIDLPFFAYGIFRPGQLGFHRLRDLVADVRSDCRISGTLRIRDGLPILDPDGGNHTSGAILLFRPEVATEAYKRIMEIEPDKQYRWDMRQSEEVLVNILIGRSPKKGSVVADEGWDGRTDPLFTAALDVIRETLSANCEFEWDLKPLFRLQMGYLLLWSSIERYASLRYHLGDKVTEKINFIASEPAFAVALQACVSSPRSVYRADRPDTKITLDPSNPKKALDYYYQIRSNITHRGKAVGRDYDVLKSSLSELLKIFEQVLSKAFEESQPLILK